MRSKFYSIFILSIVTMMIGCRSALKLYQKGKYDEAVEVAAKKLQKDPGNLSLQNTIIEAYRYAVNDHESAIASYEASNNDLKWEWIYNEYASLQRLYDAIYRSPQVYQLVQPADYSSSLITYAEKAGEAHFERGLAWMRNYDKESFKNAYAEFQTALKFIPGDQEVISRLNEAYELAVTNVVILPVTRYDFQFSSYNYDYNNYNDRLISDLKYNSGNRFVKFYSPAEARNLNVRVDRVIELQMQNVLIGRVSETRKAREVSKEVVTKEITYKPDSVVKVYGTVKAKVNTVERARHSEGSMLITIRNESGRILWTDILSSHDDWYSVFATYTGDDRALSDSDKKLLSRKEEFLPSEGDVINYIYGDLNSNSSYKIRDYFSRM